MKKHFFWLILLMAFYSQVANAVSVTISDGIDNLSIKLKMENAIERILNEVNSAQADHRMLNFYAMGVNQQVQRSMGMLWENTPFRCTDEEIVEHCISTGKGYQIRNIPLMMKPTGEREFNEDEYQEAVISFDKQGRRQMILDYVEQFRTAYNQKDINFLNQIFSEDALIITGNVITQKHPEGFITQKIRYNKQNKQQYLNNLRRVFKLTKYIKVYFDDIEVMIHPTNPNYYGVILHQGWTSNTYHDEGYVFLLWNFTNEYAPEITVRTWQPDKIAGRELARDEIFSLSDFDIQ